MKANKLYKFLVGVQVLCLLGIFYVIASNIEQAWMSPLAIVISSFSFGLVGIVSWWVCVRLGVKDE